MVRDSFKKLIFNPFELSDEELLHNASQGRLFTVLGGDAGIMGSRHMDPSYRAKQVRYVLYLYDKESPLWQTDPDIVSRKKKAASLAGYDILSDESGMKDAMMLTDVFLAKSVSTFIAYQNSGALAAMIANEQVLHELQGVLMETDDDFKDDKQKIDYFKTKTDLTEKQDKLIGLINKYRLDIWKNDDIAEGVTMELEYGRKATPEQIACIELKMPDKILR